MSQDQHTVRGMAARPELKKVLPNSPQVSDC